MIPSPAQQLVVATWCACGLVCVGLGSLTRRVLGGQSRGADDLFGDFWLGWVSLLLVLQVWHLARPVDDHAAVALALAGCAGLVTAGRPAMGRVLRRLPANLPAVMLAAIVVLWLSNHALHGARYGDVAAYFTPTVRWYLAHAIVPGLGNLHGHYALNQSHFLYVAALERGPFAGRAFHVANSLLVVALCLQATLALWRIVRWRAPVAALDVFVLLMLPGILPLVVGLFFTSPNPDLAIFALGVVATATLVVIVAGEGKRRDEYVRVLVLLTLAGITVKLSFVGFALALLPVVAVVWLARERPTWSRAIGMGRDVAMMGLATVGVWIGRNLVLSGFPLFPSAIVVLPVEWRVQTDVEGWLRNTVYEGGVAAIVASPVWFLQQLRRWGWDAPDVLGPIVVAGGMLLIGVGHRLIARAWPARVGLSIALVLPALGSLAFCLVMSPVPRYAGATVWLLAATAILFALRDVAVATRVVVRGVLVVATVAVSVLTVRGGFDPLWVPLEDFEPMGHVAYEPRQLETGAVINVPTTSEACGDAPLPCTPYLNPALRLRRANDLSAGFMLDPVLQERYHYDPGGTFVVQPAPAHDPEVH